MNRDVFRENCEKWSLAHPREAVLLDYVDPVPPADGGSPEEAKTWINNLDLDQVHTLYVYGIGMGHYYEAAKEWLKAHPESRLIFLENNIETLAHFLTLDTDLLDNPQVQLHYFKNLKDTEGVFEVLYWSAAMQRLQISALQSYKDSKTYQELHHKLIYDAATKNALVEEYMNFGASFYRNFYLNILQLHNSYLGTKLYKKFKGVPAIITGAGPSLERQIPYLENLKDKALIFAGGSSFNALAAHGITPSFGAGIDPNALQVERLRVTSHIPIPFLYRNRMQHEAFMLVKGQRLYIPGAGGYEVADWFEKKFDIESEFLDEGHNVVNFCLQVAYEMECSPIIFVGMDLAYTNLKAYSTGVVEDASIKAEDIMKATHQDDSAIIRKDIHGEPVYTLWKWVAEADWISEFAHEHLDVPIINATEGGIGFPGVPNRALKDIPFTQTFDLDQRVQEEIAQAKLTQVTPDKLKEAILEMRDSLKRCVEHLDVLLQETYREDAGQSGLAALSEVELADEPGYIHVLEVFNAVYSRLLSHKLTQIRPLEGTKDYLLKKNAIQRDKLHFLKNAALANIELINYAVSYEYKNG